MIRNLKVLGLGLIAVFAFSAMAASSASAVDTFTSSPSPVTVSGTSTVGVFKITSPLAEVKCATGKFHGAALVNGSSSVTVTAVYEGTPGVTDTGHCGTNGFGTADVNMNGCDYVLTGNTTGSDSGTDATVSVVCSPTGNEITIKLSELGVTLKIPAQTPTSGGATYTNNAGKVKVKVTATGVTYTCEPAFLCGLGGLSTEANNADYNDEVEVTPASGTISVSSS